MMKTLYTLSVLASALFLIQSCSDAGSSKEESNPVKKNVQYVSGADAITYIKVGTEVTDSVQAKLKANLVAAMQEGGPINAVEFCNTKALPLTASYSGKFNTEVKRVSDRNRNPKNAANEKELEVINDFKKMLAEGKPLTPKVSISEDGEKHYYAPIFTGGVCLTCHGNPKNMQPELVSVIDSLYPNDKAKGYAVDELRGIWSVKFKNS